MSGFLNPSTAGYRFARESTVYTFVFNSARRPHFWQIIILNRGSSWFFIHFRNIKFFDELSSFDFKVIIFLWFPGSPEPLETFRVRCPRKQAVLTVILFQSFLHWKIVGQKSLRCDVLLQNEVLIWSKANHARLGSLANMTKVLSF